MPALIMAIPSFTLRDAVLMRFLNNTTKKTITGTKAIKIRANRHSIVSITAKAPKKVTIDINRSSGP